MKYLAQFSVMIFFLCAIGLLAGPICSPPEEICDNGIDDDGDSLADCDDAEDCLDVIAEVCDDGQDNDCDGAADCDDSDCLNAIPETCDDGQDNDCDGASDCDDTDCLNAIPEDCGDGVDNDCDTATDCDDENCYGTGPSSVVINEFMYNPFGNEVPNEWVELCNVGNLCEDLSGATIKDASNVDPTIFPAQTIFAPQSCKVVTNNTPGTTVCSVTSNIQWRVPVTLNNTGGDTITLKAGDGTIISQVTYLETASAEGFSVARCFDDEGNAVYVQTTESLYDCGNLGSPGSLNTCD